MDCYSEKSELIETLDYLSPSVKRIHNIREAFGSAYNTKAYDVHMLRGLRNKFARRAPSYTKITRVGKTYAESSTSLILKTSRIQSERQILEHYPIVSYTSLHHPEIETSSILKTDRKPNTSEKQLIKVTVIPKTNQIVAAKLLKKQGYIPQRVTSTTSNRENSIKTNNVYIIDAGRRKEKIHEIKTTSSEKFTTDLDSYMKNKGIPIIELLNFNHLIQSLNMDGNKRKNKKVPASMDNLEAPQRTSLEWKGNPKCEEGFCTNKSKEAPKKSHVRIFGQFGISEEDKYVLRCGATVNDKHVMSDVAQLTRDFLPVIAKTSYGDTDRKATQLLKESCTQADHIYDLNMEKLPMKDEVPSKESHGTQVNFNVQIAMNKGKCTTFSDKKIQCSCCAVTNDNNDLKDCQSPLVIISVYHKPSPEDLIKSVHSPVENTRSLSPTRMNTYISKQLLKTEKAPKKTDARRNYKSPPMSRSQSPVRKEDLIKSVHSPVENTRSPSPTRMNTYISNQMLKTEKAPKKNDARRNYTSPPISRSQSPVKKEDLIKSVHSPVENTQSPSRTRMNTYISNQMLKTEQAPKKTDARRNYKSPLMSRSQSPVKKASRSKVPDNTVKVQASEKRSTDNQKALRAITEKIQDKDKIKQDAGSRKLPSKFNTTKSTRLSKNYQNQNVLNATQFSRRNQQLHTSSNATQDSKKKLKFYTASDGRHLATGRLQNYTVSNATKHSNVEENAAAFNAEQCKDTVDGQLDIAPIKHSKTEAKTTNKYTQNKSSAIKNPRTTMMNDATQVPRKEPFTDCNATQVAKNHQNFIASRDSKNQETFSGKSAQVFKSKQDSKLISDTNAKTGSKRDYAREKKALVETYTKKLTEQMNQKDFIPAGFGNSKVRINIEGDKEYYDVLYNPNKLTTNLTIRKTLKEMGSHKCNQDPPSLESLSIGLYNNCSDDELLTKHVSRLTIRDSLEIHRREDKNNHNNIKTTQTCFMAQFHDNVSDETEFLAPIKHFTGDDCSISDPIERDKQIRELLGVDKDKPNYSKTKKGRYCENDDRIPYQCIYRQECKKSQATEINDMFPKLCHCIKPNRPKGYASVSVQCQHAGCVEGGNENGFVKKDMGTQFDKEKSAIYQQLILNRNIQVFLQVDHFSKQKPIILSRKQYDKVKKTIQKTITMKKSSHDKRKSLLSGMRASSEVSIGEVRPKGSISLAKKVRDSGYNSSNQNMSNSEANSKKTKKDKQKIGFHNEVESSEERKNRGTGDQDVVVHAGRYKKNTSWCKDEKKQNKKRYKESKGGWTARDIGIGGEMVDCKTERLIVPIEDCLRRSELIRTPRQCGNSSKEQNLKPSNKFEDQNEEVNRKESEVKTFILFNAENTKENLKDTKETDCDVYTRKIMPSVKKRYASEAFVKQVAFSSMDVGVGALFGTSIPHLSSFETISRGHRKTVTPNLGISAYSLYSEDVYNSKNISPNFIVEPRDSKPKKTFLRRLIMSCLTMRSNKDSELKLPNAHAPNLPSIDSSIDSHYISSSIGAVKGSSSIYDTSASFYSNHTIFPVNSKIKRGFFSSIRGFLTNRKS